MVYFIATSRRLVTLPKGRGTTLRERRLVIYYIFLLPEGEPGRRRIVLFIFKSFPGEGARDGGATDLAFVR